MDEIQVPAYYVVSRAIPKDEVHSIFMALRITPVHCAVISDILDADLALQLTQSIVRVDSDDEALDLAASISAHIQRPVLVVGVAALLDGIYLDGRREAIAIQC